MKSHDLRCLRRASRFWCGAAVIAVAVTVLWGCAHLPAEKGDKALRDRVFKAWDARAAGDCAAIYALACSHYRKNVTKEQHMARPCKGHFQDFHVGGIEISADGNSALATIQFDTKTQGVLLKGVQIKERWLREKGEWRLDLPIDPKTPFTP